MAAELLHNSRKGLPCTLRTVSPKCGLFKALRPGAPELKLSWGLVVVVLQASGSDCHNCEPIGTIVVIPRLRDRFPIQFCSLFFFEGEGLEGGQRERGRVGKDEGRVVFPSHPRRRGRSIPGSQSGTGWGGRFEEVWGKKFGKVSIITRGRPEGGGSGGGGGVSEKGREGAAGAATAAS